MFFAKEMVEFKKELEKRRHRVSIPKGTEDFVTGARKSENKYVKIDLDVLKDYFEEIGNSDAILVLNKDKNNIKNYIGGNSLIEMAFAHVLEKNIFLLNPIPEMTYTPEIQAMKTHVINNDISLIK